uniref:aldehyde dehydrogenase family protein n=1 Tax=Bradyrhizobium sp. 195 TaxID=2782662 RepID=UPI0020979BAB|nr:aldehyde dehydrogenase family protein [Bradyrhizobium sp. 195]
MARIDRRQREDLALILTSEQGKPLSEALGEVDIGGANVEFYTEEARRIYGETIPSPRPDAKLLAIKHRLASAAPSRRGTSPTR